MFLLKELNEAHDVLRNVASTLSVGGYNATNVDAKVFGNKIHEGIAMLVDPLLKQIEDLKADKERLLGRVADEVLSGWRKDEKIAQNKEAVVAELTLEGCSYAFKKNGMVDIVILSSGRGFTRHVNNIGLSVQKALEKQLSEKRV
jgi:ribosomal protein L3